MKLNPITEPVITGVTITLNLDEAEELRQTLGGQPATNLNCDLWEALSKVLRP
jgi:hypothetical protein